MLSFIIRYGLPAGVSVIILFGSFFAGYKYSEYKCDSNQLEQLLAQQEIMQEYLKRESSVASLVEEKLEQLKANERILERERIRIVEKPVYNISCIDEEGQALLKKYALGGSGEDLE